MEVVITSVGLPRSLHEQAKMAATRLNWVFAEVVRAALTEWLARHADVLRDQGGR